MPTYPGKEPFHRPVVFLAAQSAVALYPGFSPSLSIRRDHRDTFLAQLIILLVTMVLAVTNQIPGLRLDHIGVNAWLHQGDFSMDRHTHAYHQWLSVSMHYRHDFHVLIASGMADCITATHGRGNSRNDEA